MALFDTICRIVLGCNRDGLCVVVFCMFFEIVIIVVYCFIVALYFKTFVNCKQHLGYCNFH